MSSPRLWCALFFVSLISSQMAFATTTDVLVPSEEGNAMSDQPPAAVDEPSPPQQAPSQTPTQTQRPAPVPQQTVTQPQNFQPPSLPPTVTTQVPSQDARPYKSREGGQSPIPALGNFTKPVQPTRIVEVPDNILKAREQMSSSLPKHPNLPTNKLQITTGQLSSLGQREYDAIKNKIEIQMYDFTRQCSIMFDGHISTNEGYVAFFRAPQGSTSVAYYGSIKHLMVNRKILCPATATPRANVGIIRKVGDKFEFPLGSMACTIQPGALSVTLSYDPVKKLTCMSN